MAQLPTSVSRSSGLACARERPFLTVRGRTQEQPPSVGQTVIENAEKSIKGLAFVKEYSRAQRQEVRRKRDAALQKFRMIFGEYALFRLGEDADGDT